MSRDGGRDAEGPGEASSAEVVSAEEAGSGDEGMAGDEAGAGDEALVEEAPDMGDVVDELADLEEEVDDPETRARVREVARMASRVESPVFGRVIKGYDRGDAAEAVLGGLVFGIPMLVEGGTQEVGAYLARNPPFLAATVGLTVAMVWGILYVADIQDVRVHEPIFGVVPRRFAGVLGISLGLAATTMTAWGRVAWDDPWLATCSVVVAFVPMAIGGALGDILPGS
ncbi:MAG: DUF2391 domain-containing protein [Halobacteriaceae archaeon]